MGESVNGCEICEAVRLDEPRIVEGDYWSLTLAQDQAYLGRAFLTARRHVASLNELTDDEWAGLRTIIKAYEQVITDIFDAQLFNWTCLMNNAFKAETPQPHVHWHVRPRYDHPVDAIGRTFHDPNFAHHYDSKQTDVLNQSSIAKLTTIIKEQINAN